MALVDVEETATIRLRTPGLENHRPSRWLGRDKVWRAWLLSWVGAAGIGVGNATLRELTMRGLGEGKAHQVSTITLLGFLSLYMFGLQRRRPITSDRMALEIGALWALGTVGFEFALGLGVTGESFEDLVSAYDISNGRIWSLVPFWMLFGPFVLRRTAHKDVE